MRTGMLSQCRVRSKRRQCITSFRAQSAARRSPDRCRTIAKTASVSRRCKKHARLISAGVSVLRRPPEVRSGSKVFPCTTPPLCCLTSCNSVWRTPPCITYRSGCPSVGGHRAAGQARNSSSRHSDARVTHEAPLPVAQWCCSISCARSTISTHEIS